MQQVQIPSYQEGLKELRTNLENMLPAEALSIFDQDAEALQATHQEILQLAKGDKAPNFTLPNVLGNPVNLYDQLKENRVILTFYRGVWCPYCNLQLAQYQQVLPELEALGAKVIAVSPQTPDNSLSMQEKNNLAFEVLSDAGNQVARSYTTVFKNGEKPVQAMADLGYDFSSFNVDGSLEIPVPATFIIDQDGRVLFAESEGGDYRERIGPAKLFEALRLA
ncbi:MAG: AhpC/TSA family protein [Saprospiraceae bacterium]|nr:AhpC/TSA family protein [Saprospiraceae bacterium]